MTVQAPALRRGRLSRDLRGAYTVWRRELIRFFRERVRAVTSFVQPLLYLLVFGSGLGAAIQQRTVAGDYKVFLLPGVVAMTVLFTSMIAAVSIVWDREFGFLKEILVAPVSRTAVILGKAFGAATTSALQGMAILVFAPVVGMHLSPVRVLAVAPMLVLTAMAINGLGLALAARVATMQGFMVVMNFITLPLFFVSGALYPLQAAPGWLKGLAVLDPLSYAVDAVRRTLIPGFPASVRMGGQPMAIGLELVVLAAFAVVAFAVAVRQFDRQP